MKHYEISYNGNFVCKIEACDDEQAIEKAKPIFAIDDRIRPWRLDDINDSNILAPLFTLDQINSNDSILEQLQHDGHAAYLESQGASAGAIAWIKNHR